MLTTGHQSSLARLYGFTIELRWHDAALDSADDERGEPDCVYVRRSASEAWAFSNASEAEAFLLGYGHAISLVGEL